MESIIADVVELKNFLGILKPLKNCEVFFVALMARDKYLNPEEKTLFQEFKGTYVLVRKTIRKNSFEHLVEKMQKFDVTKTSCVSRKFAPDKAFVCYFSVNPRDTFSAFIDFSHTVNLLMREYVSTSNPGALEKIKNVEKILETAIQSSTGSHPWVDIDIDVREKDFLFLRENFLNSLDEKNTSYVVIETKSGYHVLLERSSLRFNYPLAVKSFNEKIVNTYGKEGSEAKINTGDLIPLPGTMQSDFLVRIVYNHLLL